MAKDYDELSENEKELMETMKTPPEEGEEVTVVSGDDEPAEQEAEQKGPKRGPDGKFTKAEEEQETESEAETEQEQESEAEEQPDKRFVPLDALHAERGRRKDAEGELHELRQTVQQLQQAIQGQQQPQAPQQEQVPDEAPDPVTDKAAFDAWLQKKLETVQQPYQQIQSQAEQYQRQQQEMQRLQQYASEHEQAFRKEYGDEDYNGALSFMRERTKRNFKLFGVPDHEVDQAVAQEEVKLTAMAAQRNINPAALIYNMAVENGYQPASKQQQTGSEAERVQKLGEAQKQTKSAAGTSGSAREEEYTVERLAGMSEAELAKLPPETIRRAMGG